MKVLQKRFLFFLVYFSAPAARATPDAWIQKSSLPGPARVAAVAFSVSGYGYVGTGLDSAGSLLDDFWKYDPANDSWTQVAAYGGSARKNAVAFTLDSAAYVGTGYDAAGLTHDFYRYDPSNNSWLQVEDLDSAGAVYPRRDAAAFSLNGKGYVVGGYDGTSFYSKETWEYDPMRDTTWKEKTAFPIAGRRWAISFSLNGNGFIGMGFNYSQEYFKDLWKYDPLAGAWTQMADCPGNDRGNASAFVASGYAFVGTGFDGALKKDFYIYDEVNNSWGPVSEFGGDPVSSASAFSIGSKGYVFGGLDTLGYSNRLWEYTPDNALSIHNPEAVDQVSVFPVPAVQWIYVKGFEPLSSGRRQLVLYDAFGNVALQCSIAAQDQPISVRQLARGIYFYSLRSESSPLLVTGRLILQ